MLATPKVVGRVAATQALVKCGEMRINENFQVLRPNTSGEDKQLFCNLCYIFGEFSVDNHNSQPKNLVL
jgi:hypothetical protein